MMDGEPSRVDRSGPLRGHYVPAARYAVQHKDSPALCCITYQLARRPYWEIHTPFAVPRDLYDAARAEMTANMKKRGFPLPQDAAIEREHFLLFGTPIMPKGEGAKV